jgi:hypothetical protein
VAFWKAQVLANCAWREGPHYRRPVCAGRMSWPGHGPSLAGSLPEVSFWHISSFAGL